MSDTILQLTDVKTHFPITQGFLLKRHIGTVKAVDGVNQIHPCPDDPATCPDYRRNCRSERS